MQAPRTLAAAFLSAAMILTSGLALAEKGGHGHGNGGDNRANGAASSQSEPGRPGAINNGADKRGGAGVHGETTTTTRADREREMRNRTDGGDNDADTKFQFHGSLNSMDESKAKISLKLRDGSSHDFDVDNSVLTDLKSRKDTRDMLFFSADGQHITSCARVGETDRAHVASMEHNTLTLQMKNGQTRVITMDSKSIARLKLHTGSDIDITTGGPQGGRIVSLEQLKKHWSDKFSGHRDSDTRVARQDIDRAKTHKVKTDVDVDGHKKVANADVDASKSKVKKTKNKDNDIDNRVADTDKGPAGCGKRGGSGHGRAFANQMAKDAANDASGHNPPGLPHECQNPAGHTRGFCKSGSSGSDCSGIAMSSGSDVDNDTNHNNNPNGPDKCGKGSTHSGNGRAYANQMAKDAANDASGHNPPGLPHECQNPAGHTRGFCKSGSSGADCSGIAMSSDNDVDNDSNHTNNNGPEKCGKGSTHSSGHGRAYANQMAKDAANDASGHNPPGLPHECVNPAGHTRGFCKSGSSLEGSDCSSATASASAPAVTTSATVPGGAGSANSGNGAGSANNGNGAGAPVAAAPGARVAAVPSNRAPGLANGGWPSAPVAPVSGGTSSFTPASGARTAPAASAAAPGPLAMSTAPVRHPTRVLGAAVGPSQIRLVRPMANTPCVWHKTTVAAATYRRNHRVPTSYTRPRYPLHHRTACH